MRGYTSSVSDYNTWLEAQIWATGNYKMARKEYIPLFHSSLIQWMKKRGYTMNGSMTPKTVARWLYAIQVQEVAKKNRWGPIYYPEVLHRDWEEDWDVFDMEVSQEHCDEFLESWINNEDFQLDLPSGQRIRVELQKFLYTYVDMGSSKHGQRVAHMVEDAENNSDDSENDNEMDSYLRDAQEGFHR